jgi:antitoxin (DNA-binding transcriptional repressor) of toxin-antitoxin stability system
VIPPRRRLKAFPLAERVRPKTHVRGGLRYRWQDPTTGTIYEWGLSELVNRLEKGEEIVISRHGKPIARLVPAGGHNVAEALAARPADPRRRITPLEVLIVGYGADDLVAVEKSVPPEAVRKARKLANVPADDPDLALAYPLTEAQAREIADVPPGFSYFLEATTE